MRDCGLNKAGGGAARGKKRPVKGPPRVWPSCGGAWCAGHCAREKRGVWQSEGLGNSRGAPREGREQLRRNGRRRPTPRKDGESQMQGSGAMCGAGKGAPRRRTPRTPRTTHAGQARRAERRAASGKEPQKKLFRARAPPPATYKKDHTTKERGREGGATATKAEAEVQT